jgi:hypothetical protein
MQKIATRIFIAASLVFGVLGVIMVLNGGPDDGPNSTTVDHVLLKCFQITIFVILPSFALSVAAKYLSDR